MNRGGDDFGRNGDRVAGDVFPSGEREGLLDVGVVDPAQALAQLRLLSVRRWRVSSRSIAGDVRLGPPVESFCNQLPVDSDPAGVSPADADAVAFAAIQGLDARLDEQAGRTDDRDRRIEELRERLDDQRRDIEALRERLESLQADLSRRRREEEG